MNTPNSKISIDIETKLDLNSVNDLKKKLSKLGENEKIKINLEYEDDKKIRNNIDKSINSLKHQISNSLKTLNNGNSSTIAKIFSLDELKKSINLLDTIQNKVVGITNGNTKPYLNLSDYLNGLDTKNLLDKSSLNKFYGSIDELKGKLLNELNLKLEVNNSSSKVVTQSLMDILLEIDKINTSVINIGTKVDNINALKQLLESIREQITSLNANDDTIIKLKFDEASINNFKNQLTQVRTELTKIKELTSIPTQIVSNTKTDNTNNATINNSNTGILATFNEQALAESKAKLNAIISDLTKERIIPVALKLNSTTELEQKLTSIQEKVKNISISLKINQQEEFNKFDTLIDGIQKKLNNLTGVISKVNISDKATDEVNKKSVYISAKLNETSKNKIISDLEESINKNDGLSIKIKNLDAVSTNAISSLKSKIEEELKDIALTIIPKPKETSTTNTTVTNTSSDANNKNKSISSIISSYSNQLINYKNLLNTLNLDTNKNADAIQTATNNIEVYKKLLIDTGEAGEETLSYITKLFETSPKVFAIDTNLSSLNEKQQEALFKNYINTISKSNQQISKQNDSSNIVSQNNELKNQVQILKDILKLDTEINRTNTGIIVNKNKGDVWNDYLQTLKNQKQQLSSQLSGVFKSVFDTTSQSIDFNKLFNLNELSSKQKSSFKQLYNKFLKNQYLNQQQISKLYENQNSNFNISTNNQNNTFFKDIDKTLKGYDKLVNELNKRGINPLIDVNNNNKSQTAQQLPLLKQLSKTYENIKKSVSNYKTSLSQLGNSGNDGIQTQIDNLEKLKTSILNDVEAYNKLKDVANQQIGISKSIVADEKIISKYSKLGTDIQKYINQNGKALNNSTFKAQLNTLLDETINPDRRSMQNLANLQTRFTNIQTQVSKLGLTGRSVGQELDFIFSKIGLKAVFGTMIYQAIAYFKQMLVTVKDIDTSMVTLKRVTSETSSTYNDFLNTASTNAKKLATTITNIIDATSSWSRLGYSLEDAITLGNLSTMYANVGFIDVDTATKDLVTSMKAFNIASDDAIKIVDAFNEIGNKFAITSADVGSGLTQSASALNVAGNTLNESIAMITGIGEITQDTDSAGNALKTLSMRLRGAKADLEDMGEDTDNLADSTAKMRDEILSLSGVDIMQDESTFKSTYQIMKEISTVWNELSDVNQAGLLEKIAGKTRANQISALITNWSQVEKALETANNSSGSATKENAKYVDSIEGKINVIKSSAQEFSKTAFSDDFLKSILDTINSIINKTEKWSELMGALPLLISAVGGTYGALGKQFGNIGFTPDWILNFTKLNQAKEIISGYSNFDFDKLISDRYTKIYEIEKDKNLSADERIKQIELLKEETKQIDKARSVLNSSNLNRLLNIKDLVAFNKEFKNISDSIKNFENILGYQQKGFSNKISEYVLGRYNGVHMFGTNNGISYSSIINDDLTKQFNEYNEKLVQKQTNEQRYMESYQKYVDQFKKQNTYLSGYIKQQSGLNEKASVESYKTYLSNLSQSGNYKTGFTSTIVALNEYNKLADANASKTDIMNKNQKDYLDTMMNLNPVFANNVQTMNRATISIQQYAIATTMSKVATLGLKLACAGLNAIIGGVVSMAIMTVVSHIWSWITSLNKLSTKMKENLSDTQNTTKTLNDYIDKLKELKQVQEDALLSNNKQNLISTNEELIALQNELIDTYGTQVSGIDLVNNSLSTQLKIIEEIQKKNANSFLQQANVGSDLKKAQDNLFIDKYNTGTRLNITPTDFSDNLINELRNNNLNVRVFNKKALIDIDGNSLDDAKKTLQSAYDVIKEYGIKTHKDYSKTLENIQKQINSYSSEEIDNYQEFYDTWLSSFVVASDDIIAGKTLNEWQIYVNKLKDTLNSAIVNNDNELFKSTQQELEKTKQILSGFDLDNLVEVNSKTKTKGLNNYVSSLFDGYTEEIDQQLQKSKVENLLKKYNLSNLSAITNKDVNQKLQSLISNPNYIDSRYSNELEILRDIMKETGVSAESLTDILSELGYVTLDSSDWISKTSSALQTEANGFSQIANDLFGVEEIETSQWNDSIENIKSVLDNGELTSNDVFNIQNSELKDVLKYNSQADEYIIDRQELEKLTEAKYDDLEADLERSKVSLQRARQSDLETIQSIQDPKIREEYQKKFDEDTVQYNEALSNYNKAEQILKQSRKELLQDETAFTTAIIQSVESEFTTISNAISKLKSGDSLSTEDISNILGTSYANTLEMDKETGLVTINIEKYKELAQAKIDAYKVDIQSNLNDLREEQNLLTQTISYYQKNILENSSTSSSSKAYASKQIAQMREELNKTNSSIEENKFQLNQWDSLASRITSSIAGSFEDISSATKDLESSASTMSSAFKEVRDNGYLSISTAVNLIDSGYASCVVLDKETNKLTLNASAYKQLAREKINDQIASLKSIAINGQNTQQIQAQIQALQLLRDNLDSVTYGSYGDNQDYWKAEAEQQFAKLEHLHNMNVINDVTYYKQLQKLNNKYYKGKIKYLNEYRQYEEEVYKGLTEAQINAQKELINKQKEALETKKDSWKAQEEYWNNQKEALKEQQDYWNDLIDAINTQIKSINKEKDYWNDQKDLLSEQKDAIQSQIDAIEEKNEEEEKTLKIQEAQLKLQNALNQKTIREFSEETGWSWTTDKNEIKEAQQELDELLKEDEVSQLEKKIDELDKQDKEIDKIIKQLDKEIDILEDEKEIYNDEIDLINDSIDSIDKEIEAINKQEEIINKQIEALDKEIEAIEKQSESLNTSHVDEVSGGITNANSFTQLSQQEINKILGLPTDFNTSLVTNIKEPMESLKNSINSTDQLLSDLNKNNNSDIFSKNSQVAQNLTISINQVNTQNASEFIDQLGTILINQLK